MPSTYTYTKRILANISTAMTYSKRPKDFIQPTMFIPCVKVNLHTRQVSFIVYNQLFMAIIGQTKVPYFWRAAIHVCWNTVYFVFSCYVMGPDPHSVLHTQRWVYLLPDCCDELRKSYQSFVSVDVIGPNLDGDAVEY